MRTRFIKKFKKILKKIMQTFRDFLKILIKLWRNLWTFSYFYSFQIKFHIVYKTFQNLGGGGMYWNKFLQNLGGGRPPLPPRQRTPCWLQSFLGSSLHTLQIEAMNAYGTDSKMTAAIDILQETVRCNVQHVNLLHTYKD